MAIRPKHACRQFPFCIGKPSRPPIKTRRLAGMESLEAKELLASIEITEVPDYGSPGVMRGLVRGADHTQFRVAPYIQIEGAGWWTKPTFDAPTVPIDADGSWAANVVSGGLDDRATILCAALVPAGSTPPRAEGAGRIPAALDAAALDCQERYARTFTFAGFTWGIKEAPLPVGPGANRFSADPGAVFVDSQGLHLTLAPRNGFWESSEVILLEELGYGTYLFQTKGPLDDLDANVTFGAFTWDPFGDDESGASPHREIDFEDGRWGNAADPTNAQIVVQPFQVAGNLRRYTIADLTGDQALTRFFTWQPNEIEFVALQGSHTPTDFAPSDVIDRFNYAHEPDVGHFVPTTGRARFRFNLWRVADAPVEGESVEVVISDFRFFPPPAPPDVNDDLVTTDEDTPVAISVLANDRDVNGDAITVVTVTDPVNGSVVINADNTITYAPEPDFHGKDSFTYTGSDGQFTASAMVTVTVNPVNDPPTDIVLGDASVNENAPGAVVGEVSVADPDPEDSHTLLVSDVRFEIVGATLKLKENAWLDFESEPVLVVEITAVDSGSPPQSLSRDLIITIQDAFDPPHPWQNPENPFNINDNRDAEGRHVIGIDDALLLVADLRNNLALTGQIVHDLRNPEHLPVTPFRPPFVDASGDDRVTLADLLLTIAFLREQIQGQATGEGEVEQNITAAFESIPVAARRAAAPEWRSTLEHDNRQRPASGRAPLAKALREVHGARSNRSGRLDSLDNELPEIASLEEAIDSFVGETVRGWRLEFGSGD